MISVEAFSELLGLLYSVPLHPARWGGFLDLLCEHTRSRSSFLVCGDSRQSVSVRAQGGAGLPHDAVAAYAAEFTGRDPFILPVLRSGLTGVLDARSLVSRATVEESDFYRHLIAPQGYRYPGAVAITCTLRRFEGMSFWRTEDEGYLDEEAMRLLELLFPHLRSAMEIRHALGASDARAAGAEAIADASATPAFLLAAGGEVLHANSAARELVSDGDGLAMRDGVLVVARGDMRRPLQLLLQAAAARAGVFGGGQPAKALSLERRSGRRPLQLLASPAEEQGAGAVLLLATDPEKPVVLRDDELREHYRFTEAETEVANGMLTGYSLDEIAALRKVKIGTVRDQVKAMLSKTGTGKQADMVRLFMTLPRLG